MFWKDRKIREELKEFLIFIFFLCLLIFINCSNSSEPYFQLFDDTKLFIEIGSDEENKLVSPLIYQIIDEYYIDERNNVYVGDISEMKIDKFNKNGEFLYSFGRKGQGPGEFLNFIPPFAVDSKGFLYASFIDIVTIFNPDGSFYRISHFPDKFKRWYVMRIKIDYMDNIYFLITRRNKFILVKSDKNLIKFSIIHQDNKREFRDTSIPNAIGLFIPDFDFDKNNNLYITDTVDYKIYVYSPKSDLIKIYEKEFKKYKITKKDLVFPTFRGDEIISLPEVVLSKLKGNQKYFPAIFGINIDNGRIYAWNSSRDKEFIFQIFKMMIWNLKKDLVDLLSLMNHIKF
ncbi:hypothetical protein NLD30_05410 [SCandidatus Aminicenantes bacterium Aminicenantia_JdfR_composite]|jgi:hypothetical protein|nr:hypothetical protein [SCandidatus Aminicenantes bacterium Aminicenantia_JdfR_composite]MCP2598550.1 hypothetical protein [Candidatus Aminicenantes bacterium AC-335-L06]